TFPEYNPHTSLVFILFVEVLQRPAQLWIHIFSSPESLLNLALINRYKAGSMMTPVHRQGNTRVLSQDYLARQHIILQLNAILYMVLSEISVDAVDQYANVLNTSHSPSSLVLLGEKSPARYGSRAEFGVS
ncbi:hypothetical protein WG66_009540, partial [Moniliophthora roreri]